MNIPVALQIFCTLPVTDAETERAFFNFGFNVKRAIEL